MNAYIRTTRECKFGDMRNEIAAAIRKHVETYKLDDIESPLPICFETTSTCKKKGLFSSSEETIITGMLISSQLLVWTNEKKNGKPVVISALLRNIDVQDFENTAMYRVSPDSGINISGRYTDVTKQGQSFIGLGSDPAGEKFRLVLQHAIQKAQS
jgi:hypothetical protein